MVTIHRDYHKNDLHAIASRLRGHLPIFGNKNLDLHLGGKGGQKEKKVHEFHFRLEIYLHEILKFMACIIEDLIVNFQEYFNFVR